MTELTIASNDDSPAMEYEFEVQTDGDVTGESLEGSDTITQTDDGRWHVTGITGPVGRDTYRFDADGVTNLSVEGMDSGDPIDTSRYVLLLDGDEVSREDVLVDEPDDGDDTDDDPAPPSDLADRLDSIDSRLADIQDRLDDGIEVRWSRDE